MRDVKGRKDGKDRKKGSVVPPEARARAKENKERKKVDVPPEPGMVSEEGLRCPRCHCRHLPAVRSYRAGNLTIRKRRCRHCGHIVTSSEKITSTDPHGTP